MDAERDGFGPVERARRLRGRRPVARRRDRGRGRPVDDALALFRRPTDSSCSSGSDFVGPAIVLDDVVNIAADSEIVYLVTGQVDSELCQSYPCTAVDLVNTATVSAPTDSNAGDNSDTDTDDLSPRADLEITKTDHISVLQGLAGASALAASPGWHGGLRHRSDRRRRRRLHPHAGDRRADLRRIRARQRRTASTV